MPSVLTSARKHMVKYAREYLGYTIQQAAKKINISPKKLEAIEQGEEKLTYAQLKNVANTYKRSLTFFYLNQKPEEQKLGDFRSFTRPEDQMELSPASQKEIRKILVKRKSLINCSASYKEFDYNFISSATVNENVKGLADKIRKILGISIQTQLSWKRDAEAIQSWKFAAESLGILVFYIDPRYLPEKEFRGISFSEEPFPIIGIWGNDSNYAKCFTLIHEMCHLTLNKSGVWNYINFSGLSDVNKVEKLCNAVAGEMLVPSDNFLMQAMVESLKFDELNYSTYEKLSKLYSVSRTVIARRLLTLGKISRKTYLKYDKYLKKLYKDSQTKKIRDREKAKEEHKSLGFETPYNKLIRINSHLFMRKIFDAFYEKTISYIDVLRKIDTKAKYFDRLEAKIYDVDSP
jgi:Zn-dependent peptidase ImmA (M78 family)/transcriptional regulator with XRE-family HTH domain